MSGVFEQVLAGVATGRPGPFAIVRRPHAYGPDQLEVFTGEVVEVERLSQLPLATAAPAGAAELLVLVPFRQLAERGFSCTDDGSPLLALRVAGQQRLAVAAALARFPDPPVQLADECFDLGDDEYAEIVRRILGAEIGRGEGANFVIKRAFTARIADYGPAQALAFFRRLLDTEVGAYWTFVVHTGDRTFVGASPERHLSLTGGTATMNPVSGTYRYPATGATLPGVLGFLADGKETDELSMVVDEELKMMTRICEGPVRVHGPYLKEMARLAHTEYLIEGRTSRDVRAVLAETLFAPTVTGSPLESACRVIQRHEPAGRGYYSGLVALIGRDEAGCRELDSAILIRTAEIAPDGRLSIGVGATLVRHSDPAAEVAETASKAEGLRAALTRTTSGASEGPQDVQAASAMPAGRAETEVRQGQAVGRFGNHPQVQQVLAGRNRYLSSYWLTGSVPEETGLVLAGRRVLVVDAEDTFTAMIARQLEVLGPEVTVRRFDQTYDLAEHDLVVMGPGPGDPTELGHPKIAQLHATIQRLREERRRFLAVCLSHQVLCAQLGLPLVRRAEPNQGAQRQINLFGETVRVGFYNTFAARHPADQLGELELSRDPDTGEVHALRGPHFTSLQFHQESILTQHGPRILSTALTRLLDGALVSGRVS